MAKISFADRLKNLFSSSKIDDSFYDDLTDALVEGDVGAKLAFETVDALEKECRSSHVSEESQVIECLKKMLSTYAKETTLSCQEGKVSVFMLLGVNGVGKTTSAAKLARYFSEGLGAQGKVPVILAASDTFRAAAEEQLELHGQRLGIRVVSHQHGSDPSAVVFDAGEACRANGGGLVIADTAGRLHNKENLVRELQKIDRIASQKADPGCYKKILVIDATTGQNAVRQAEVFNEAVGVDAIIMTKYDSTAKGGVAFTIGKELGIPVAFVCTGEHYEDIAPFSVSSYVDAFLGR